MVWGQHKPKSQVSLEPATLSPCMSSTPHVRLGSIMFYFHVGNLAHGTLGHVIAAQAMWLNIQCQ